MFGRRKTYLKVIKSAQKQIRTIHSVNRPHKEYLFQIMIDSTFSMLILQPK